MLHKLQLESPEARTDISALSDYQLSVGNIYLSHFFHNCLQRLPEAAWTLLLRVLLSVSYFRHSTPTCFN